MIITELIEQLKAMPEKMEGRNGEGEENQNEGGAK